ncbi:Molybdenum cofactor sulfurase, partial [Balamuthia mandrillaris]
MNEEERKQNFLQRFGEDYGYGGRLERIRSTQFSRLAGVTYLDHAGATLHSETLLLEAVKDLNTCLLGNTHSQNPSSATTLERVQHVRHRVLRLFNASPTEYGLIFTHGCTAALKLVGECFPWSASTEFRYSLDSHNSVLGIREYAAEKGSKCAMVDLEEHDAHWSSTASQKQEQQDLPNGTETSSAEEDDHCPLGLFVFPGECNFTGKKHDLRWVHRYHNDAAEVEKLATKVIFPSPSPEIEEDKQQRATRRWYVMVDAAALAANAPLDLSRYPADFVAISFYKMFGYPSGLGALIVKKEAASILRKTYFGGGTIAASSAGERFHILRNQATKDSDSFHERFEDGSLPFLNIISLRHFLPIFEPVAKEVLNNEIEEGRIEGGIHAIARHTSTLIRYLHQELESLRHNNGRLVVTVYGRSSSSSSSSSFGPILSFNLRKSNGDWVGYRQVEKLAAVAGIHLRGGCFCNPGACH